MEQHIERLVTGYNEDGTPFSGYMLEAQYATTKKRADDSKWAVCTICNFSFKQSEMVFARGKWYCTKRKCNQDLEKIR